MSLKNSRGLQLLKEQGIKSLITHIKKQPLNKFLPTQHGIIKKLIKLHLLCYPYFTLSKTEYKAFKSLKKYFKENYEDILLLDYKFFNKNLKAHIAWMQSNELQNTYGSYTQSANLTTFTPPPHINNNLVKNPPLLNPKELNHLTIDSKLAFALNLPIDSKKYKFILVNYTTSGSLAWTTFLSKSGLKAQSYSQFFQPQNISNNEENTYLSITRQWANKQKRGDKILNINTFNKDAKDKKIIILVRDPISRMKTQINHGAYNHPKFITDHTFTLFSDPEDVLNRIGFFDDNDILRSNVAFLHNSVLECVVDLWTFSYLSNITSIPQHTKVTYYDIKDIMPKKAFNTISNLARELDFNPPQEDDRAFYEDMKFNTFAYVLPLIGITKLTNNHEIQIHITTKYTRNQDLKEAKSILFTKDYPLLDAISCSMNELDYNFLQNDSAMLTKIQNYMEKFIMELKRKIDYIQKHRKTEEDILECLSMDKNLRKKIKALLDKELAHIKENAPEIVATWKYYLEFEKLCSNNT